MAEKEVVAGLEVIFKLIADMQSANAESMKAGVKIQSELSKFSIFKPTADMSAVQNVGDQVGRAVGKAIGSELAKAEVEAGKHIRGMAKLLEEFGQGMPPRRTISQGLTGALSPLIGEGAGSLLGGAAGLLLGSMVFRVGWSLAEAIGKLPDAIAEQVQQNQRVDVMRARMANMPASELDSPKASSIMTADKQALAAISIGSQMMHRLDENGQGGEEFKTALNTLVTKYAGTENDPAKRAALIDKLTAAAASAEFGHLGGGMDDALKVSNAAIALQLTGDKSAAQTLLNQPGMMQFMLPEFRKQRGIPSFTSDANAWEKLQQSVARDLDAGPKVREQTVNSVMAAYQNVVANNPNIAAMRTKSQQEQWGKDLSEVYNSILGSKEKLSLADIRGLDDYSQSRKMGMTREQALKQYEDSSKTWHGNRFGFSTPERMQELTKPLEAALGAFSPLLGGAAGKYMPPILGQPQFSFSSLSDFANKMQKEAGFQMDDSARTADAVASTDKKMDTLIAAVNNLHPGAGVPLSPNRRIPSAVDNSWGVPTA
jgi:hypothetical protein